MRDTGLKLFFDGGCRPNPGAMQTAVVSRGVTWHRADLGHGTSNDAEWLALLDALAVAQRAGAADVRLLGDSALVVSQANGTAKCRTPALQVHLAAFNLLVPRFVRIRIRHVARSQNLAGIALARLAAR